MKSVIFAFAVAALTMLGCERRQSAMDFVQAASVEDLFQTEASKLATGKGQAESVKRFAEHILADASERREALRRAVAASQPQVVMPTALDRVSELAREQLYYTPTDTFDKFFTTMETARLGAMLTLYEDFARSGDNEAVKRFANDALPKIRERLAEAKALPKSLAPARLVLS